MARVTGLDIGQTSIRAVVLETTLRGYTLVDAFEAPVVADLPPPDSTEAPTLPEADADSAAPDSGEETAGAEESPTEVDEAEAEVLSAAQQATLAQLVESGRLTADSLYTALPGRHALLTRVSLPFANPREIRPVLAPQLEGRLPAEVDEVVFDFVRGDRLPSGEYAVHTAAAYPERVDSFLQALKASALDPRGVDVAPFPLLGAAHALLGDRAQQTFAVVDIGAHSTALLIASPEGIQLVRTLPMGGERVTQALAEMFKLSAERAREGKHLEGFVRLDIEASNTPSGDNNTDIAAACRRGVDPLIRQLRRTLHAHASEWGQGIQAMFLCGGGSRLGGLAELLSEAVGVPVEQLPSPPLSGEPAAPGQAPGLEYVTAFGLALSGTSLPGAGGMNLRQGALAFRGSHEYLLKRLPSIVLGVVILLGLGGLMAMGQISMLKAESRALDGALESMTRAVFGEAVRSPSEIQRELRLGAIRPSFIPSVSAYVLFADITQTVGETLDLGYELTASSVEVDLERRVFRIGGTADSAESVDMFQTELAKTECFKSIERDDLSQSRTGDGFTYSIQGVVNCGNESEDD